MKKIILLAVFCVLFVTLRTAHAQQFDAAIGFGSLTAPSSSSTGAPSLGGGLYPSFSADYLVKHQLGFQGQVSWRASQNSYFGLPYRPIFFDFNGIWAPRLGKKAQAELMAGIGAEDVRVYGTLNCGFTGCTNYTSTTHFLGHFGGGIRYYVWHNVFVRPEAHYYAINNNNEFNTGHAARFAISIGYSFRPGF